MRNVKSLGWLILLSVAALGAANPPDAEEIARAYKRALAGDKQAVESCIKLLEVAVAQQPANQVARVYLGSAYTLRSRDLSFGPGKLATLKQGLAMMDAAVTAAPDNPRVRLVRALTTDSLPFFLGRKQSTAADFEWLVASARANPQQFTEGDLQTIYFSAGNAAKVRGDHAQAIALWKQAALHPADAGIRAKISAALDSFPDSR